MVFPSVLRTPHGRFQHSCSCTVGKQICSHGAGSLHQMRPCEVPAAEHCPGPVSPRWGLLRGGPAAPAGTGAAARSAWERLRTRRSLAPAQMGGRWVLQPTAWCRRAVPLSPPAPHPQRRKKGTFVEAICSPARHRRGRGTASILTLCWLTQSPSMAAALGVGLSASPWWLPRGNTAQHRRRAPSSTCCSKGHQAPCQRAQHLPLPRACSQQGWQAPAQRLNLLGPLQHGQALPHQASHAGQLPAVQVALRMHPEQTWSSSSLFAHWDKCFCELRTGQRGVSGSAITQTLVTLHFFTRVSTKFGFFSIAPFNLKMKKTNSERRD